jgi:hypothetical protein
MKNVEVFDETLRSGSSLSFIVEGNELEYFSAAPLPSPSELRGYILADFSQPSRSIVSVPTKFPIASLRHHLTPWVFGSPLGLASRVDICN